MDQITIEGIEAFGHHGVLEHERRVGQRFVVDLELDVDLSVAAASGRLADTVDYGALAGEVAAIVAGEPVDLLETLATRIAERCLEDRRVSAVAVKVHKPGAPLPTLARDVSVTIRRSRR